MPEITKSGAKLHLFIVTHKYTDLYFIFFFQQPTPGRQANLGLRLYNRPSAVASPHRPPSPIGLRIHIVRHHPSAVASQSDCANGAIHRHRRKTAEERFNMLARGWLAYPVTPTQGTGTRTIGMRQRRITPRNPIRTKRQRRAHGASAGTIYMRFGDALLRRPRERSRLQLTPDRVGGTRTDAYAPRSAAAERSIAKCRKLGRR